MNRILILGGYGSTGRQVAGLLLRHTPARLVLVGRRLEKAQALTERLNAQFEGRPVAAAFTNAADCCFVTDGGFHPGLPAALIRAVAHGPPVPLEPVRLLAPAFRYDAQS